MSVWGFVQYQLMGDRRPIPAQAASITTVSSRPCGHTEHSGCCPECQRAQIRRWADQLRSVS